MASNSGKGGNTLYFIIGALVVAVLALGFYVMQEEADKPGIQIEVSEDGIKVD